MNKYWINEWAIVRRNEMAYLPDRFDIHNDFLATLDKDIFESTFRYIWDLFFRIYTDIATKPEKFGIPLYSPEQFHYGSKEANNSRRAAWDVFNLLLYMFYSGEDTNNGFVVDAAKFKSVNSVKNIHIKNEALVDYGFVFLGLNNYKLPKTAELFTIRYPDNPDVLTVLHLIAIKVYNTQIMKGTRQFENAFISWNCRILKDDLQKMDMTVKDIIYDKIKDENDRTFIDTFHDRISQDGFVHGWGGWNEGPGICYYDKQSVMDRKGPYLFRILSWKSDIRLMLRIRNAEKCMDYLQSCPQTVKEMFRPSDRGCSNRHNGCQKGVGYVFEGEERWKCGCCNAPFIVDPITADISHYMKLVELGCKR